MNTDPNFNNSAYSNTGLNSGLNSTPGYNSGLNSGLNTAPGYNSGLNSGLNTAPGYSNTGLNSGLAGGQIPSTFEHQTIGNTTTYAATGPAPGVPGGLTTTYVQSSNPNNINSGGLNNGVNDPNHPPSALKGNITSMMGKMQHNPQKQLDGNMMVANSCEQKAVKFENKALQWEQKGNVQKAQKNREKAIRYRQKAAAKLNQPLTTPKNASTTGTNTGTTTTAFPGQTTGSNTGSNTGSSGGGFLGGFGGNKEQKAQRCEQKALEYERKGNLAKAQRNREKAWRIREKNSIAHPTGAVAPLGYTQATNTQYTTAAR